MKSIKRKIVKGYRKNDHSTTVGLSTLCESVKPPRPCLQSNISKITLLARFDLEVTSWAGWYTKFRHQESQELRSQVR